MLNRFVLVLFLIGSWGLSAHGETINVVPDDVASGVTNTQLKSPQEPSQRLDPLLVSSSPEQDGESASFAEEYDIFNLPIEQLL
jgi:hypothetical protein